MLDEMKNQNMIEQLSTILWEIADGCTKQYCCATTIYLLSLLSKEYNIVIDRAVGAPGHGKDVVDGLNAVDKAFLKKAIMGNKNPEQVQTSKDMLAHEMSGCSCVSFAETCHKL